MSLQSLNVNYICVLQQSPESGHKCDSVCEYKHNTSESYR